MNTEIQSYNQAQTTENRQMCEILAQEINKVLLSDESKIWHGHPVWFLNGNPIAGYAVLKHNVQLLFWSGQSFDEPELKVEGTFKAAAARYTSADQINTTDLARWLKKSRSIQLDYKNIVKRKGVLEMVQKTDAQD